LALKKASVARQDLRTDLLAIGRAGIAAVDAARLVEQALRLAPLAQGRPSSDISILAAGKAAVPMASAATKVLGDRVRQGLIVGILPAGTSAGSGLPFPMIIGGHPTPT